MNIIFLGARQAGLVGFLAARAEGVRVQSVIAYDEILANSARMAGIPTFPRWCIPTNVTIDLILSVHGREILPPGFLAIARHGGVNVHPLLERFPGARPVERFLEAGGGELSVSAHRMTQTVDCGEVLARVSVGTWPRAWGWNGDTVAAVYNALYPAYAEVVQRVLDHFSDPYADIPPKDDRFLRRGCNG